jgi:hypothetical protein
MRGSARRARTSSSGGSAARVADYLGEHWRDEFHGNGSFYRARQLTPIEVMDQ